MSQLLLGIRCACECGNDRRIDAEACSTCAALDGADNEEQTFIAALIDCGGRANKDAMGLETGLSRRTVERWAASLSARGVIEIRAEPCGENDEAVYVLTRRA